MRPSPALAVVLVCAAAAAPALAVESCDLNGQHVNPNNGNTPAGKGRFAVRVLAAYGVRDLLLTTSVCGWPV